MNEEEKKSAKMLEATALAFVLICFASFIFAMTDLPLYHPATDPYSIALNVGLLGPFLVYPILGYLALSDRRVGWITVLTLILLVGHLVTFIQFLTG